MKFTDLDASKAKKETIRVEFDGFDMKIGNKTVSLDGQWIDVYPTDSEQFQAAKVELNRKAITKEKFDTKALFAALIADWSFDEECTEENKTKAAGMWPTVLIEYIDKVASTAINFTRKPAKS